MSECQHTSVNEQEGDTWTDTNGKLHTVIKSRCANPFCSHYGKTVRIRQTGADVPQTYMMPPYMPGVKP